VQGKEKIQIIPSIQTPGRPPEPLKGKDCLYLGIDVGSTSSDVVILDSEFKLIYSDYKRTKGRSAETLAAQLCELLKIYNVNQIEYSAATGSAS
jgi:activator of 2-hydroxyglutaryl-CoA dehydratase